MHWSGSPACDSQTREHSAPSLELEERPEDMNGTSSTPPFYINPCQAPKAESHPCHAANQSPAPGPLSHRLRLKAHLFVLLFILPPPVCFILMNQDRCTCLSLSGCLLLRHSAPQKVIKVPRCKACWGFVRGRDGGGRLTDD